jgi:excisionase family DNA binding protein
VSLPAAGITFPEELIRAIAVQVADELERRGFTVSAEATSPYLTVAQAADYIAAKPQRLYDLISAGRLTPARDGARVLLTREQLDAYVRGGAT